MTVTTAVEKPRLATSALVVAAAFGLFYAYAVWAAIGNAIRSANTHAEFSVSAPWWLLALGIVIPVVLFVVAFLVGRRRKLLDLAVCLLAGLAVTAALGFGVIAANQVLLLDAVTALR